MAWLVILEFFYVGLDVGCNIQTQTESLALVTGAILRGEESRNAWRDQRMSALEAIIFDNICACSCPSRTPRLSGVAFNDFGWNRFQIKSLRWLWHRHFFFRVTVRWSLHEGPDHPSFSVSRCFVYPPTVDTPVTGDMCVGIRVSGRNTYRTVTSSPLPNTLLKMQEYLIVVENLHHTPDAF